MVELSSTGLEIPSSIPTLASIHCSNIHIFFDHWMMLNRYCIQRMAKYPLKLLSQTSRLNYVSNVTKIGKCRNCRCNFTKYCTITLNWRWPNQFSYSHIVQLSCVRVGERGSLRLLTYCQSIEICSVETIEFKVRVSLLRP